MLCGRDEPDESPVLPPPMPMPLPPPLPSRTYVAHHIVASPYIAGPTAASDLSRVPVQELLRAIHYYFSAVVCCYLQHNTMGPPARPPADRQLACQHALLAGCLAGWLFG